MTLRLFLPRLSGSADLLPEAASLVGRMAWETIGIHGRELTVSFLRRIKYSLFYAINMQKNTSCKCLGGFHLTADFPQTAPDKPASLTSVQE